MGRKIGLAVIGITILFLTIEGCLQAPKEEKPTPTPTPSPIPTPTLAPTPTPTAPVPTPALRNLPPDAFYVDARTLKPSFWGPERYGLNSLKVEIHNQMNAPVLLRAQIISGGKIVEERTAFLERQGSSISFTNERKYFITDPKLILRIIVEGYKSIDYNFVEVAEL